MSRRALSLALLAAGLASLLFAQATAETPQVPDPAKASENASPAAPAPAPAPTQSPQAAAVSVVPLDGHITPPYGTVVQNPPGIPDDEVPYGMAWYGTMKEAEWSPFDSPFGPYNYWDAYTWGFIRYRYWFDCQRFGGCWSPFWSPLGWGWDPWYGGWYGYLPNGVPAGYSPSPFQRPVAPHRQMFRLAQFAPVEVIAPKPTARPPVEKKRDWFHREEPQPGGVRKPAQDPFGDPFSGGRAGRPGTGPVSRPSPPRPMPSSSPSRPRLR